METRNFTKLKEAVISHSIASEWEEAKKEWLVKSFATVKESRCCCSKLIHNVYTIRNKFNGNTLPIGSSCIRLFAVEHMIRYVERREKEAAEAKKRAKYEKHLKEKYQQLKKEQQEKGTVLSVRQTFLEKRFDLGIINDFEYKFYNNIYWFTSLTEKQSALKEKINTKLLASITPQDPQRPSQEL